MGTQADSHLQFVGTLAAMSICAHACATGAQAVTQMASATGYPSTSPSPDLRAPAMPGSIPAPASAGIDGDPFEQEVRALEDQPIELSQRPIVFYGSSSIRLWKSLGQDFSAYPVVNCGFGGSRLSDCVRYVSPLVLRLQPAAVVLYAGDNDLAQGASPDQAFASFRDLYGALRGYSAQMPIAYISVKPCPARIGNLDNILRFNQLVKAFLHHRPAAQYIDVCTAMLGPDRKPDPALFVQDQIHLSKLGYQILRQDVSTFVSSAWRPSAPFPKSQPVGDPSSRGINARAGGTFGATPQPATRR
jgi:lysophospholipase L1-like esterase